MTNEMENHVADPGLRSCIMPTFNTTTPSDHVVAAILMVGALQKYFSYTMHVRCGIRSVTLLGERDDWHSMLSKLNKLSQLGHEPATFAKLLRPTLEGFVASFDNTASPSPGTSEFWGKCVHHQSGMSGPDFLSGWITAFCFWDENGQCLYDETFPGCQLGDVLFHGVDTLKILSGFTCVPVTLEDDYVGVKYETNMVVGPVGFQATYSGKRTADGPILDSLQPVAGWWMYEKAHEDEAREEEMERIEENVKGMGGVEFGDKPQYRRY